MGKKILFGVSVFFNALFLLAIALSLAKRPSSFVFLVPGKRTDYLHAASILSVPLDGSSAISIGPANVSLMRGSAFHLQLSQIRGGRQSNSFVEPLYDRDVIAVEQSGFGLLIQGIRPGETLVQVFSPSGFINIAHITVTDPYE
jgi:hypothetical protein